jgi:NAD(P) transhydrogenase subunit alpha
MVTAFVPKEVRPGETRVAATPETVRRLTQSGVSVEVERGAGAGAWIPDASFEAAGAKLAGADAWPRAELVLKVQPPTEEEVARLREGAVLVSFLLPGTNERILAALRGRGVHALAMDQIPRITRAQSMDALSSQATIAGYKAVVLGAAHLAKLCPLLMTAAGTIAPARAVVFGAGVAGLQAIATARRLGCLVEATDIRRAAKEQVESLGARFIDVPGAEDMETAGGYAKEVGEDFLRRQREEVAKRVAEADLVITTALVPGRPAPKLVSEAMVRSMRPGSVIVDLAVESGGNCELTSPGEVVVRHGVTLVGISNLPATVPLHASELYAKNVLNLVKLFVDKEGRMATDFEDEILAGCLVTRERGRAAAGGA